MVTVKGYIIARNPLCTSKFLNSKTPLVLEHMADYYRERETMIDYYISVLKEAYEKYGYDNPFTSYGAYDERFINADFSTKSMQTKMNVIHNYASSWRVGIKEAITDYIYRRTQKYFAEKRDRNGNLYYNHEHPFDNSYKNYFYLLALDEKIFAMYNDNKKYLKKYHSKLKHRDLIYDYVENALQVKKNKNYEEEIEYITPKELKEMEYDEIPSNYEMDNFLGPKGPGR